MYGRADQLVALFTLLSLTRNHPVIYALLALASKETGIATLLLVFLQKVINGERYKTVRFSIIQRSPVKCDFFSAEKAKFDALVLVVNFWSVLIENWVFLQL